MVAMSDVMTGEESQVEKDRSRFAIFRDRDAPSLDETGMMQAKLSEEAKTGSTQLVESGVLDGSVVRQLFRHAGEDGFSLVHVWFKPNYHLPRHSHDADCLYYVLSGEVIMGSQVLAAGDGFYVPLDQSYGYRAGPEGVEVLEFRHSTSFDIRIDEKPEVFGRILQTVKDNRTKWAADTVPPSRR
jgi:quercetin dioxygenase-like cupin family protein